MNKKIAIVTGGTRGIGRAISLELAARGYLVYAGYATNTQAAQEWLQSLQRDEIHNVRLFQADVATSAVSQRIEDIIAANGRVDILVNNAGITNHSAFDTMTYAQWQSVIAANVDSMFHVTQPVVRAMKNNKFGRIINISSVNGQKGQRGEVNYSMTKAAIIGFTKALAQEVAEFNITVNTVSPGYINTDLTDTLPGHEIEKILANVPVRRLGLPTEIAKSVAYLADESSGFITGANIAINGGLYMN